LGDVGNGFHHAVFVFSSSEAFKGFDVEPVLDVVRFIDEVGSVAFSTYQPGITIPMLAVIDR